MNSSLVIGQPSWITTGFTSQSVFSGLAILPIRVKGNTVFSSYTLTPTVSSGLNFNSTTGEISGTYNGITTSVQYQLTGTNSFGSISTTFTLHYKRRIFLYFLSFYSSK